MGPVRANVRVDCAGESLMSIATMIFILDVEHPLSAFSSNLVEHDCEVLGRLQGGYSMRCGGPWPCHIPTTAPIGLMFMAPQCLSPVHKKVDPITSRPPRRVDHFKLQHHELNITTCRHISKIVLEGQRRRPSGVLSIGKRQYRKNDPTRLRAHRSQTTKQCRPSQETIRDSCIPKSGVQAPIKLLRHASNSRYHARAVRAMGY
jgi:hypothetical protein